MFTTIKTVAIAAVNKVRTYGARFGRFAKRNGLSFKTFLTTHKVPVTTGKFLVGSLRVFSRTFLWFVAWDIGYYVARSVSRRTFVRNVKIWLRLPVRTKVELFVGFMVTEFKALVLSYAVIVSALMTGAAAFLHLVYGVVVGTPTYLVTRLVSKDTTPLTAHKAYVKVTQPTAWVYSKALSLLLASWTTLWKLGEETTGFEAILKLSSQPVEGDIVFSNDGPVSDTPIVVTFKIDGGEAAKDPFNYGRKLAEDINNRQPGAAFTFKAMVKKDLKRVGLDASDFVQVMRGYDALLSV